MSDEDTQVRTSSLDGLWAVQRADAQLADARARRAALDDGGALRAEVEAARAAAAGAAAQLRDAQAALRDHELQLQGTEARYKKAEGDLYGGRISNPKELASLQEDLASLARARDRLEDRILELLEQVEALRRLDAARLAALRELEQRLATHITEFEVARDRIDAEIAALAAQRAERASTVAPRLLKKYENIAVQEGGVGMVAIVGGHCGGCRNDVPSQFVSRIRLGQVVTCERCHRILYINGAA